MRKLYNALLACACVALSAPAATADTYPAINSLIGTYKVSCSINYTDNCTSALKSYLTNEFEFTLNEGNDTQLNITNFPYTGASASMTYDQTTGVLTYNLVYARPDYEIGYVYIAPADGGYTGMTATTANYLKFQIGTDGSISIPNFSLGTLTGGVYTASAEYSGFTVTETSGGNEEEESFAGAYTFQGTKYTYADGVLESTEPNLLSVVINNRNQVTSIMGYELTAEQIANGYNTGSVNNGVFTLTTGFNVGVEWIPGEENTESYLLGAANSRATWRQGERISIYKNAAGEYSITPFTIWHRTWELVDPDDASKGSKQVYTLLYKWAEGDPVEDVDFAGTYEMKGKYYYFTDGELTSTDDGEFELIINTANQLVSLAGETIDQFDLGEGRNEGTPQGNTLIWTTSIYLGFSWETDLILLGGEAIDSYSSGAKVSFTKNDNGTYTLTPFTIWRRSYDGINFEYTLLKKWDASSSSEVKCIESVDADATPVYYDMQGRRVAKPSAGLYIVKKGNSVTKVLVK